MKQRTLLLILIAALTLSLCTACAPKSDDGDENYIPPMGEFTLPTTETAEENTVEHIVAQISEKFTIRDYYEMRADLIGAEAGYTIRVNGINMELYQFDKNNEFFKEIVSLGAYPIKDDEGKVLKKIEAYVNGSFVLVVTRNTNDVNEDVTEKNQKVVSFFKELQLV